MPGRPVTTRISNDVQEVLNKFLPKRAQPTLLRALLILAAEALKRDPFILTDILAGAVQPHVYEMRIYKKDEEDS